MSGRRITSSQTVVNGIIFYDINGTYMTPFPRIIAHRGYSAKYPENTLQAFQKAVEYGADSIELDVQYTADKQLVVYHDATFPLPNKQTPLISEMTLSEMQKIDPHITTLDHVFSTFGDRIHYEVELKSFTREFLHAVVKLVTHANLWKNIECTSFQEFLLRDLRQQYSQVRIGFFVLPFPSWMPLHLGHQLLLANLDISDFTVAHCATDIITPELVQQIQQRNKYIHASNCATAEDMRKAIQLGVDQFAVDDVETAVVVRNSLNRT